MRVSRLFPCLVLLAGLLAACSSEGDGGGVGGTSASTSPASTEPSVGTTGSGGGSPDPSDCPDDASTAAQAAADPLKMSSLVGKEIRFAVYNSCTDRVVIELQGDGEFPGWTVEYSDGPPGLGESDEKAEIEGGAILVAHLGSWMTTMEGDGYDGPREIKPKGLLAVKELELVGNDEGVMRWAIGIDEERPFAVATLPDPPRLVIDIDATG